MDSLGKLLMMAGVALVAIGGLVWLLGHRGGSLLPGDLAIQKGNVRFYFPVVTCLAISLALTLLAWWFRR